MDRQRQVSAGHGERVRAERAADRLVGVLEMSGVRRVFGVPGGTISPVYDALVDSTIEVVTCQHEQMAVYLAYGHARATGVPGVVLVTSGPGVLNTVTGVAAALLDEVPLVVIAGEVAADHAGRGALQDGGPSGLDLAAVFRPLTRAVEVVDRPDRVEVVLHRAFQAARSHPRGPVLVRVPMSASMALAPRGRQHLCERELPDISESLADEIGASLGAAARPTIRLGIGARTANVGRWVLQIAEWTRCPIVLDIESRGQLDERHPLCLGVQGVGARGGAAAWLAKSDFILAIGARFDDTTTSGFAPMGAPGRRLVQLDHDPHRLGRAWHADVVAHVDLRRAMERVAGRLPPPDVHALVQRDAAVRAAREGASVPRHPTLGLAPHHPGAVVAALAEIAGPDTIFCTDIGNHHLWAASTLEVTRADGFHISNGLGGMGSGIGVAIGLAIAHGADRRVIGICGDGSALMVGNELNTCALHRVPLVLAIFDDGQLGMVEHGNTRVFGRSAGCEKPHFGVAHWARALGARVVEVQGREDLVAALRDPPDGPLVLVIPIDPDVRAVNPREAVLAFPEGGGR